MSVEQKTAQLAHVDNLIPVVEQAMEEGREYVPVDVGDYYTHYQPIDAQFLAGMRFVKETLTEEVEQEGR